MEILHLFQYITLCGVGYAGLSTAAVLAQTVLSGAVEVKFLFAAMKGRSPLVKTAASLIPMVLAATYIIASSIGFAAFLAGAWEEYNYLLLAELTLTPSCITQMLVCVGAFVVLAILYTVRYPMKPLQWLITFGVETLAALSLLVLYGGLFLRGFPFTVIDLCLRDVTALRWPIYGLFTVVFKDFVLIVSLVLGALLQERKPRADFQAEDAWDGRLRPGTAKIYRQLLSLGEEHTVLRLFYQEMVEGTPRVEKLQFNVSRTTSEHFQLTRAGLKSTVVRIAPPDP